MSRWKPDAAGRLATAALELYSERGFEVTTVAEIAERAGLTERTFFRHFADKREVLFAGSSGLQDYFVSAVVDAPDSLTSFEAAVAGLNASAGFFDGRKAHSQKRQGVIEANQELQERELIKLARLASAIAEALRRRGVTDPAASLTGEMAIAVFKIAFSRWINDPGNRGFPSLIQESLDELKAVTIGT
jgi:AcrR family transcriptional regulator